MTPFEAWVKACEEMKQQIVLLEKESNQTGDRLRLYALIRQLPPIPTYGHGWNSSFERYYILWYNDEKMQSFTDYRQAFETFRYRCDEYIFDDAPWS